MAVTVAEVELAALKAAVRAGHAESVALLRVLSRTYDGTLTGDRVNAEGVSEIDIEFFLMGEAVSFARNLWVLHRARSDVRDPVSSLWESVTLTVDVDDETYQRIVANLRAEDKTVCASGAVIEWTTVTRPDPTPVDRDQTCTVTEAVIPLRGSGGPRALYGGDARVSITHYTCRATSGKRSWVSVSVPGKGHMGYLGHRARYVRADVARRVAERVASFIDARCGVDSGQ